MKRNKVFIFLSILFWGITVYSQNEIDSSDMYKVIKIDTIYNAYLIQMIKLNNQEMRYSVVIIKDSVSSNNLEKIIIGGKYKLKLRMYKDNYVIVNVPWYDVFIGDNKVRIREKYNFGQIAFSDITKWKLIEDNVSD